ncbi:MAG: serine/threonine protein kinase [Nitrososphaerota archaeon]
MLEQTSYAQWTGSALGEYRLTRLLSTSPLGPLFTADSVTTGAAFLVRVLNVPPAQTPEAMRTYQTYLERQAGHLVSLRHPYMLPLVNYGTHQGLPYLVWPYTTMRSLTTRLSQSGVLDVVTAGRYLDQIAATLEYAHQNATIHRNLSLDCIYLQLDGQIAVADFGVRRLYELLAPGGQTGFFAGSVEACAPEQLMGGPIGPATDVYALGAVTYRMLTGQPVFSGENFRALAEQHLHAPPPSISRTRVGFPVALDRVLAGALAKDATQRIQHPGAFADAYHQVIAPTNSRRVPFDAPGSGGVANTAGPRLSQPPQVAAQRANGASPMVGHPGVPMSYPSASDEPTTLTSAQGWRHFFARGWWFFLLVLVLVPLVSAGIFFLANNRQTMAGAPGGTLVFMDSSSPPDGGTDGLRLTVSGLAAPPSGSQYQVWLVNRETEQITALGKLAAGTGNGTYHLVYSSPAAKGKAAANILAQGDMVEVTEEQSNVVAPAGHVVLAVTFPKEAFVHIGHLLVSFPATPGKIGLLVGALRQTKLLDAQARALDQAAGSGQTALVQCLAQSIVDISEGKAGAHYKPLDPTCVSAGVTETGDGYGLLNPAKAPSGDPYSAESGGSGYIKNAADHASLATAAVDATEALRQHASKVQIALAGVTKSVTTVDGTALTLLKTPTDASAVATLVAASGAAYQGTGSANDSSAVAAYLEAQQMATLSLTPSAS